MADLNSTIVRGNLRVTDDINTGGTINGDGSGLTNLNASNIGSGTLSADRLATSGATAGSYGPSANAEPGYGSTFNVPYITVDNKGRVTTISTKTVKIPASDNTNTAVQTGTGTTTNNNSNNTGLWSTIGPFVNMILVLIAVIACVYGIVWLLKKSMRPGAENDPYLKKTASITLSPGKTVQVVTLQDKAYLLGVSDSSITLISEIEDKELIDAMNLNTPVGGKKPANFAALLASLTGSAKRTENFLRSKREKLNNGEGQ